MGMFASNDRTGSATDHGDFQSRLDAYAAGDLDDVGWLMMRTHLAECTDCQADLRRPKLWNRAAPQRVIAGHEVLRHQTRETAPGWTVALGIVLVAVLVTFGIGYALGGL